MTQKPPRCCHAEDQRCDVGGGSCVMRFASLRLCVFAFVSAPRVSKIYTPFRVNMILIVDSTIMKSISRL